MLSPAPLLRPRACALLGAVLAVAQAVAQPAPASTPAAPTLLVRASHEPIGLPFPTATTLPQTVSLDAMSAAEILQVQREIYDAVKAWPDRRVEGIDGCMQWLFLRHAPDEPWLTIGYNAVVPDGGQSVKINGAMRRAQVSYGMTPRHGSGGAIAVLPFHPRPSLAALMASHADDHAASIAAMDARRDTDLRWLTIARAPSLAVTEARTRCTHLQADCRRYVAPVGAAAGTWDGAVREPPVGGRLTYVQQPIALAPGLRTEVAIEDMCPFGRLALIERPINTRVESAEVGLKRFGIPNNPSLKDALRPFVAGAAGR